MTLAAPAPGDLAGQLTKAFYSPSDVADLAGISASTVLHYIHNGKLAAVKLSERVYRIPRKAVIRLLAPDEAVPTSRQTSPDAEIPD